MITNLQATCVSILLLQSCLPHKTSAFVNKEPPSDEYPSDFFPPIIDADDISYFFPDDLQGLHWALTNIFSRSRRNPSSSIAPPLPDILVSRGGGDTYTSEYKLMHDIQQVEYLVDILNDTDATTVEYLQKEVLPIYQRVLRNIPPLEELTLTKGLYAFSQDDYDAGISTVYNKALYGVTSDELYPSWREESLLNSRLDWEEVEHQWFGENNSSSSEYEHDASSVVVIDELLNDHTLDILRKLLLRNTHWYQTKTPLQFGKYVGAYIDDGLNDPIFLELAKALHDSLPRIMKGHDLRYLWAYKYDSEWSNGINLHADQAGEYGLSLGRVVVCVCRLLMICCVL
jgi:hypothetical protein